MSVASKKLVLAVEHTYSQCKEVHARDGNSGECFLLGVGCQDAKDIKRLCLADDENC
jgi:hypothetical protein